MATWTTSYINDLPDSAFLYIEDGGAKDGEGKTKPRSLRHFPFKDAGGSIDLPHLRNALSRIPQSSLPSDVKTRLTRKAQRLLGNQDGRSREEFRALAIAPELREEDPDGPTLFGHLAVFNEWTEIKSRSEGHFLERVAPTAFTKTIQENRPRMRVLFQHGKDPTFAEKPLGPIREIGPDGTGARYEVPLLDTSYNRDLAEMLRADPPVLGSSFRFEVMRDDWVKKPEKSAYNPRGLPERTLQEVRMSEFGPVTFPAYIGAGAGLRSLTDRMLLGDVLEERFDDEHSYLERMSELGASYIDELEDREEIEKMEAILAALAEFVSTSPEADEAREFAEEFVETHDKPRDAEPEGDVATDAPPEDGAGSSHPVEGRRGKPIPLYAGGKEERPRWKL